RGRAGLRGRAAGCARGGQQVRGGQVQRHNYSSATSRRTSRLVLSPGSQAMCQADFFPSR
ncbi:hypothetical protein, partial [uncultured Maricaulis sp.]|uniref:hypothetical protein n=1 Tax=uncultured Maricaulis sp. TaxID=174710 RepID=UPI0030DD3B64